MSKLLEKLERISQGNPAPLGFGAAAAREKMPPLALLAYYPSPTSRGDPEATGVDLDGALLQAKDAASAQGIEGKLWGIWLEEASAAEVAQLKEKGCDFIAFGPEKMPLEALRDEEVGRVLVVDSSLSEERLGTIEALPVDIVLIRPREERTPLTLADLMDIQVAVGSTGKPALLLWGSALSKGELETLRDSGIYGVVVDTSRVDTAALAELKQTINGLAPPRPRGERGAALLPRITGGRREPVEEEEEEEEYF